MHDDIVDGEAEPRRIRHICLALSMPVERELIAVRLYQFPRFVFEFTSHEPRLHHLAQNAHMPSETLPAFAQNRYFLLCFRNHGINDLRCRYERLSAARMSL